MTSILHANLPSEDEEDETFNPDVEELQGNQGKASAKRERASRCGPIRWKLCLETRARGVQCSVKVGNLLCAGVDLQRVQTGHLSMFQMVVRMWR
jgi:hypothetical protein